MDLLSEEKYIIAQAKRANHNDPFTAKAWLLTAKTLYPNNFHVQLEAYNLEKLSNNFEEAAKCFNYIFLNFSNQPVEMWDEISNLSSALRAPEGEISTEQEFYVKMFQHVSYDVQHKILIHTVNHTNNNLDQCKLLLLLLKRFPQAVTTHSPKLLEMIAQGMSLDPSKYQEMLVEEALPLIYHKSPEISPQLVCRIFTSSLEYYIKQLVEEENKRKNHDIWKEIFHILTVCGKLLKWDPFLPFNSTWSKDVYWQKLLQIVAAKSTRECENKEILFYATTLFVFALQEYITNTEIKSDINKTEFILMEGLQTMALDSNRYDSVLKIDHIDHPHIAVNPPCSKETPVAFVTAANCWQLLNRSDIFAREFNQLLLKFPLSSWISSFLFDLAVYLGEHEEASKLMNDLPNCTLRKSLQTLNIMLIKGPLKISGIEYITQILMKLPNSQGQLIENISAHQTQKRHLILLPVTYKSIVHYCTRVLISCFQRKFYEPNCSDMVLGNLLILTQLEYPKECVLAEQIFAQIKARRQLHYFLFPSYLTTIDFIEEFMHIWHAYNGEIHFEFLSSHSSSSRRIGTRGADKGVRDDFKQIIKQQITHSNEDMCSVITRFITAESTHLIQSLF